MKNVQSLSDKDLATHICATVEALKRVEPDRSLPAYARIINATRADKIIKLRDKLKALRKEQVARTKQ